VPTRITSETLRAIAFAVWAGALACGSGMIATPDGAASDDAAQAAEVGSEASAPDAPAEIDVAAEQPADGPLLIADAGDGDAEGDGRSTEKSDGDAACYDGNVPNAGCCKTQSDCPTGTCCGGPGICVYCGP
jgi:hypothetical protein